jgi:hypothetical protein
MTKHWWDCKQYQLKTGKWVPLVHLYQDSGGALEVLRLFAPEGKQCETEEEARAYSEGMARKWLHDRYL